MKPIVLRFHCKEHYHLALSIINLCERFNLSYTFDIEDVGSDDEVTSLWIVIVIRGESDVL